MLLEKFRYHCQLSFSRFPSFADFSTLAMFYVGSLCFKFAMMGDSISTTSLQPWVHLWISKDSVYRMQFQIVTSGVSLPPSLPYLRSRPLIPITETGRRSAIYDDIVRCDRSSVPDYLSSRLIIIEATTAITCHKHSYDKSTGRSTTTIRAFLSTQRPS